MRSQFTHFTTNFRKHKVLNFIRDVASYDDLPKQVHNFKVLSTKLEAKESKPWVHSSPSSQQILWNIIFEFKLRNIMLRWSPKKSSYSVSCELWIEIKKNKALSSQFTQFTTNLRKYKVFNFTWEITRYDDLLKWVHNLQAWNCELQSKESKPWVHCSPSSL